MKIENILFIVPSTNKIWKKELKNKIGTAPLGAASISSMLKVHGYTVKVIDMLVENINANMFLEIINDFKPDILCISASYTESILEVYNMVKYLKKHIKIPMIAGGVHVTYCYEEALNNGFDYVTFHEGESTLIELLEFLKADIDDLEQIKNIAYIKDDNICVTSKRKYLESLDILPFSDLVSLKLSEYVTPFAIVTSRGCPGDCIYCSSRAMSGKKYRIRSAESVFSEVFYLAKRILFDNTLIKSYIAIYDDTFTVNKNRLKKFCKYMIDAKMNIIPWKCESRIDILTEELIAIMAEAGCFALHVGIESSNQSIIDSLNKHIDFSKVEPVIKLLNKYGIQPLCSFIIGNHLDTHETLNNTKTFIQHIINEYNAKVAVSPNTPLPGTQLFENREKYGVKVLTDSWSDFSLTDVIISTRYLTADEIRNYYTEISDMTIDIEVKK